MVTRRNGKLAGLALFWALWLNGCNAAAHGDPYAAVFKRAFPDGDAGLELVGTEVLNYLVQQNSELASSLPGLAPILQRWDAPHLRAELAHNYRPYRTDLTALVLAGVRKELPAADAERLATSTDDPKGAALLNCVFTTAPGEDGKPAWSACTAKAGTRFDAATMASVIRFRQAVAAPYGSDEVRWGLGTAVCAVTDAVAANVGIQHDDMTPHLTFDGMTFGLGGKSEDCPAIRAGAAKRWPGIVVIGEMRASE